jgi:hypothetical protein
MTENAISKRTDRFTQADIGDEIVVMRLDSGEFFSLTETSAATWRLIDGTRSRSDLLRELAAQFDGDHAVIAADVDRLLADLVDMDLVTA